MKNYEQYAQTGLSARNNVLPLNPLQRNLFYRNHIADETKVASRYTDYLYSV